MPISPHQVLLTKLREHSTLSAEDVAGIERLPHVERSFTSGEDIVRQGDQPRVCVVVLEGMVARYHMLPIGYRQYLSFHIAGDMPDAQTLFLDRLDHAVCAIDDVRVSMIPHQAVLTLFRRRPETGIAIWRETLIDAAIFREAITNNSARDARSRLAHFLCEQYYRSRAAGLSKPGHCRLALTQAQIGEALGMSLVAVNRTLMSLRHTGAVDFTGGDLRVHDWAALKAIGQFDPVYLHLNKPSRKLAL